MLLNNRFSFVRYLITLVIAMCLNIAPWPDIISKCNPDWILLVLIYWTLAIPERIGIFNGLFTGLLTDVLTGRILGQHALTYALVAYFCLILHKRLRRYPLFQQGIFIFVCLLTSQLLIFWIENTQSTTNFNNSFWLPIMTGTFSWPIVYSVLRFVRQYRRPRY